MTERSYLNIKGLFVYSIVEKILYLAPLCQSRAKYIYSKKKKRLQMNETAFLFYLQRLI